MTGPGPWSVYSGRVRLSDFVDAFPPDVGPPPTEALRPETGLGWGGGFVTRAGAAPPEEEYFRPLYARLLRLRHVDPGALLCFFFFEGTVILGLLFALAELVNWWGVLILPASVAAMVKVNDLVAGAVARSAARVPAVEQERFRQEFAPAVGRAPVPRPDAMIRRRATGPGGGTTLPLRPGGFPPSAGRLTLRGGSVVLPLTERVWPLWAGIRPRKKPATILIRTPTQDRRGCDDT